MIERWTCPGCGLSTGQYRTDCGDWPLNGYLGSSVDYMTGDFLRACIDKKPDRIVMGTTVHKSWVLTALQQRVRFDLTRSTYAELMDHFAGKIQPTHFIGAPVETSQFLHEDQIQMWAGDNLLVCQHGWLC